MQVYRAGIHSLIDLSISGLYTGETIYGGGDSYCIIQGGLADAVSSLFSLLNLPLSVTTAPNRPGCSLHPKVLNALLSS